MEESNFHVPEERIGLSGKTQEKGNPIQPKGIVGTRTALCLTRVLTLSTQESLMVSWTEPSRALTV